MALLIGGGVILLAIGAYMLWGAWVAIEDERKLWLHDDMEDGL